MPKAHYAPVLCAVALVVSVFVIYDTLGPPGVHAARSVQAYAPFTGVQLSAPLNLKISPAATYTFDVSADQQVLNALNTSVSDSVLYISTSGSFETKEAINATVHLPHDALQSVTAGSMQLVAVDEGFTLHEFSAFLSGQSTLYLQNITTSSLDITASGLSTAYINGDAGAISLTGSGKSTFYISGNAASIDLSLNGLSQVISNVTSDDLAITGDVSLPSKVSYTNGKCTVSQAGMGSSRHAQRANPLGNACQQTNTVTIPAMDAKFSCGLSVSESSGGSAGSGVNGNSANAGNGGNGGDGVDVSSGQDGEDVASEYSVTVTGSNGQNGAAWNSGTGNQAFGSSGTPGAPGTAGIHNVQLQAIPCAVSQSLSMF